jgi:hypothetical protein
MIEMDEKQKKSEELPLDFELDLLVDEELAEDRRRELLKSLDKAPAHWRDLSIRFLERQVERKAARQLISGAPAASKPAKVEAEVPPTYLFSSYRFLAVAAGLLIAVTSALVTSYVMNKAQTVENQRPLIATHPPTDTIRTELPSHLVGMKIPVEVSVTNVEEGRAMSFFSGAPETPGSRRSIVIKSDGHNNALVIPVKSLDIQ